MGGGGVCGGGGGGARNVGCSLWICIQLQSITMKLIGN